MTWLGSLGLPESLSMFEFISIVTSIVAILIAWKANRTSRDSVEVAKKASIYARQYEKQGELFAVLHELAAVAGEGGANKETHRLLVKVANPFALCLYGLPKHLREYVDDFIARFSDLKVQLAIVANPEIGADVERTKKIEDSKSWFRNQVIVLPTIICPHFTVD